MSLESGGPARFLRGVHPSWRINSFMASNECPVALIYDGLHVGLKFLVLEMCIVCSKRRTVPSALCICGEA